MGRPPKRFPSSGTTEGKTLSELGISRELAYNCRAIASLPGDVFNAELAAMHRGERKVTTRSLVNLARNLPSDHRRGSPFTEALRAALRLTADERRALCRAIDPDEAAP